jgi:hypothetical protein
VLVAWIALTAAKEFVFDFCIFTWGPGLEDNAESGGPWGDVLDFSTYMLGTSVSCLALRLVGMV